MMNDKKLFQAMPSLPRNNPPQAKHPMTDQHLFLLCKRYGAAALEARRKFAGLLPEVYRRRLYERKKFASIFDFAAKLAGMTEQQVRRVLNLEKNFEDKPALRHALVFGEVSANKLAKIASIATSDNQEELAEKAKLLSTRALETLVRDEKIATKKNKQNGFDKAQIGDKSVHVNTNPQQSLPDVNLLDYLSPELQKNLIERLNKGININQLLTELLQRHDLELAQEKEQLGTHEAQRAAAIKPSRYIAVKIRQHLRKEHGTKCSIRTCAKPAEHIHHTQRFALARTHDPRYLAPLCKEHHQIAHTIDAKYHAHQRL